MRKLEGTVTAALIESGRLRSADIMLEHAGGSFWGWLIRLGTGNYWNHAFMVCSAADTSGQNETLIIDPRMGGIRVVNAARYFETVKDCDVAVRRLDRDWFQNDEAEGVRFRKAVSGFALRRIEEKTTVADSLGKFRRTTRKLSLMWRFVTHKRKGHRRRVTARRNKLLELTAYSCSGVVQWSYYWGVARVMTEEVMRQPRLAEITFASWLEGEVTDSELLSITPADLAKTGKLQWKYVIKNGVVWEVSGADEVNRITRSGGI